ncbi:MAG: DEAD/DEAH box helicase [Erysipelotrichia bacterium]|nr:DEAD/DEAH box helicase [Erysipelotrichia bacterium]
MNKTIKFKDEIEQLIAFKHFDELTPIQKECIPLILSGRDVIGISSTGTGKSHAFILPILQMIDTSKNEIQAIITAPTRELAAQLYQQVHEINRFNDQYRIKLITSGKDKERMMSGLKNQPHIVIGTIGRLKDLFVDEAVLRLDKAKCIVIDEADMTLEMGFLHQVDEICGRLDKKVQMLVFSATVPAQLQPFLHKYMTNPVTVEPKEKSKLSPDITHILVNCRYSSYQDKLLKILPGIQPYVCLIFAKTKKDVIAVAELLKENNYPVAEIHGDLSARERKQALKIIASNKASYVVCSDIMARGLDIDGISHVISLGLPSSVDYYTHRSGRTGRAGRSGISILLFNQSDIGGIKVLKTKGFKFESKDYRNGQWVDVRPFDYRPGKKKISPEEVEIQKIAKKPVKKVKPGYKKKRQQQIDDIRRRQRRLMIKAAIKAEQKERAKKAQREKKGY